MTVIVAGAYLLTPYLATNYGQQIPDAILANQPVNLFIVGCLLCFIGVVSCLSILLGLPRSVAVPAGAIQFSVLIRQLQANYEVLRRQLKLGFNIAALCIGIGTTVALTGILASFGVLDRIIGTTTGKDAATTATLVGLVMDLVSGVGLYLFKVNFDRLNTVSDRLLHMTQLQQLFEEADALDDEVARSEMTKEIIRRVLYGTEPRVAKRPNILRIRYCVVVLGTCVGWPWLIARSLFWAKEGSQNLILCS
jgi:hypothetical protein